MWTCDKCGLQFDTMSELLAHFNKVHYVPLAYDSRYDLNNDGIIDELDYSAMVQEIASGRDEYTVLDLTALKRRFGMTKPKTDNTGKILIGLIVLVGIMLSLKGKK